ncbi:Hypothetical predicted protein [Pelobates cultripes]|uniref:L1 transposable element RRM domain-containing protein n=1 Tax=Pelobates cultripes TaxID=61616 RepID=A0AAD1TFF9_PELCU|nr:Hypothetical predicted protein [Pelobates cultripes]
MDGFVGTPVSTLHEPHTPNMAPTSPASTCSGEQVTLADIGAELRRMTALMVTKEDLTRASDTLHAALKAEVAGIKSDIARQDTRITAIEQRAETAESQWQATDTAIRRQGDLILAMRRHLEDLDNRGRRNNIRVRGVPEADGAGENIAESLTQLFRIILREEAPDHFRFDRAHRALRPRTADGTPRDIVCCIHSFTLKEQIMLKARSRAHWTYRGAEVTLYNDLSLLTLDARRALRPVTSALRDRNIPYRWGYPFSINVRRHNELISARCPEDIPAFLQKLEIPNITVQNWILHPLELRPQPQRPPRRRGRDPQDHEWRPDPAQPEE